MGLPPCNRSTGPLPRQPDIRLERSNSPVKNFPDLYDRILILAIREPCGRAQTWAEAGIESSRCCAAAAMAPAAALPDTEEIVAWASAT